MTEKFEVVLIGVIFDPANKKILIGRRENDPNPKLNWCFPGGRLNPGESVDKTLKQKIKLKTGYEVKNLGCVFSQVHPDNKKFFCVYFLCEIIKGKEKSADDLVELKWVKPEEVEKYFGAPMHKRMKELLTDLTGKSCENVPEE